MTTTNNNQTSKPDNKSDRKPSIWDPADIVVSNDDCYDIDPIIHVASNSGSGEWRWIGTLDDGRRVAEESTAHRDPDIRTGWWTEYGWAECEHLDDEDYTVTWIFRGVLEDGTQVEIMYKFNMPATAGYDFDDLADALSYPQEWEDIKPHWLTIIDLDDNVLYEGDPL